MPDPTDAQIEALARDVVHLESEHEVAGTVAIGNRILAELFGGDYDAFRSRSSTKGDSIERLSAASGRAATVLRSRVEVSQAYPRYDAPFRDQISFSHHVELLSAPEIERNQLCRQAAMQDLTVRALHRLIFPDEKPEPTPRTTRVERILDQRDAFLAEAERAARDPERADAVIKHWQAMKALASDAIKAAKTKPKLPRKRKKQS
jgi:hypothetical protein